MFKLIVFFFVLLLSTVQSRSQQNQIDSLKKIINSNAHDTIKLSSLKALLDYLPQQETEQYNVQMIALSEIAAKKSSGKIKKIYEKYAAEGYYNKGVFLSNKSESDSSIIAYNTAINLYTVLSDEESVAYPKMNMAIIYTTKGDFKNALNLLYEALRINEKYKNKEALADCNIHLGRLYHIQKMDDKALASITVAYNLYKEIDYKPGIIDALHKLSVIANDLSKSTESTNYLKQNVAFIAGLPDEEKQKYLQTFYTDKATIANRENNLDSSIYYNKKSVAYAIENNNLYLLGTRYLNIAEAYKNKKDYQQSLIYGNLALAQSEKNDNLAAKVACTKFLSSLYPYLGNYKKAHEMLNMYVVLNDSVQKIENTKSIVEQQLKYDFEKKDLTKAAIQAEKNWKKNMLIALICGLFLITAIVTFFIIKNQQKKNIIQKQLTDFHKQKAMLAQMNPHFIFNAINSIQNFVLHNNSDEAYNYLTKFSKLIRMILHNSNKETIKLSEEIEALNLYISLEQLRFSNSFEYKLHIADNINLDNVELPTMLIQPYVENAIWHGLMNLNDEKKGVLSIEITEENELLKVVVKDNGIGRKRSAEYGRNNTHNPLAMKITAERLAIMKQTTNANEVKVQIVDLLNTEENAAGTEVILHLPQNK